MFPIIIVFDAFRLHTAALLNTSLKCIIFQLKEQKVVVDELSNLKKNRVSGFNSVCREVAFFSVLNCFFFPY